MRRLQLVAGASSSSTAAVIAVAPVAMAGSGRILKVGE